jgi:hypothetical protein
LIVKAVAASPSGMSQSQIASTRSATAAEGRMLLEKPSATICSSQSCGCNSRCERPIGCPDTTRKAPSCSKSRKQPPKPSAAPHSALGVFGGFPWLFLVAIITVETFRHEAASHHPKCLPSGPHRPENQQLSLGKTPSPGRRDLSWIPDRIGIASLIDVHQSFEAMSEMVMN